MDHIYYDMLHHSSDLEPESRQVGEKVFELVYPLSSWVCCSEYGMDAEQKMRIGADVSWRLVSKILGDLEFMLDDTGRLADESGCFRRKTETFSPSRKGCSSEPSADLEDSVLQPPKS